MKKNAVFHRLTALMLAAALAVGLCVSASAASFSDVPSTHWAAGSISRCAELGFFKGESAANFGVGKPMTRAAFVTALCRFFGWDTAASAETPYEDVRDSAWYAGAVSAAYGAAAITTQRSVFRPDDAITREEMAVMLVRALGYTTIAGLVEDHPFTDVTTNAGYIAMAYDMGLVTGTTATTFSPDSPATREQAAVILMRLYDKLHTAAPRAMALISQWPADGMDLGGYDTVALEAGRFAVAGKKPVLSGAMDGKETAAATAAARAAGAGVLFYASARSTILKADVKDTAALLAAAVEEGGYDGVYLDVADVPAGSKRTMTALAEAVDKALGDKLVYVGAQGASVNGSAAGYDYEALAAAADELVVHAASPVTTSGGFTSAPAEPVEEIYCALSALEGIENVTLSLSARATAWRGSAELAAPTAATLEEYLAGDAQRYYSQRYEAPYLRLAGGSVVWYCDGESAAARLQLLQLLGVDSVCICSAEHAAPDFLKGLKLS